MQTISFSPHSGGVTLVLLDQGTIRICQLDRQNTWRLGRSAPDSTPDIPLSSPIASRSHGTFFYRDGQVWYQDAGSANGTLRNGRPLTPGRNQPSPVTPLSDGDELRIDYQDLHTPDPRGVWMLVIYGDFGGKWSYCDLTGVRELVIGRDPSVCDLVQPLPYISRQHAKLTWENGRYYVSDCRSLGGTWLNGARLEAKTELHDKDRISLCDCHFIFAAGGLIYNDHRGQARQRPGGQVILQADIRSKQVPLPTGHGWKELLRDIRLDICSGQLIALLGGSGAGKTTLMNCMNGFDRGGMDGTILFHGEDFFQNYDRLKCLLGSVPQENVLHRMLTVEKELTVAARLRLSGDTPAGEIADHVSRTLEALNLTAKRRTRIEKLSGGEQKRVNIGVELVADRELLFLDEPDAGLDPQAKRELFTTLRRLAHDRGKTVLAIIHDVSEIDLFDQMILLVKAQEVGRLAYAGTPEGARQRFSTRNLAEVYGIIARDPAKYLSP